MFANTGFEFVYTQAPKNLKSVLLACWMVSWKLNFSDEKHCVTVLIAGNYSKWKSDSHCDWWFSNIRWSSDGVSVTFCSSFHQRVRIHVACLSLSKSKKKMPNKLLRNIEVWKKLLIILSFSYINIDRKVYKIYCEKFRDCDCVIRKKCWILWNLCALRKQRSKSV